MGLSRLVFIGLFSSPLLLASGLANAVPLIQHRAVYDLKLTSASERSGITGITGRMVYEIRGSACDGYSVRFRYVTQSSARETSMVTDQQTTTFEEPDGKSFSFATKTYNDQVLDKDLRGEATRNADGVKVQINKPDPQTFELQPTQFPTQHLVDLIHRANSGETFYETTIFDGSDEADKAMITTVVVGKPTEIKSSDPELKALDTLSSDKYWPVDIAYFNEEGEGGEETPQYRISFKLHENGLTRDMEMDYGDFSIHGTLVDLALFGPEADSDCAR